MSKLWTERQEACFYASRLNLLSVPGNHIVSCKAEPSAFGMKRTVAVPLGHAGAVGPDAGSAAGGGGAAGYDEQSARPLR